MADSERPSSPKPGNLSRRDTLKLATAVSALGVGLGVALEAEADTPPAAAGAVAQKLNATSMKLALLTHKIETKDLGKLSIKLYKLAADGSTQLVHSFDLSRLVMKNKASDVTGRYSVKMFNIKGELSNVVLEEQLILQEPAIAPEAAPPATK